MHRNLWPLQLLELCSYRPLPLQKQHWGHLGFYWWPSAASLWAVVGLGCPWGCEMASLLLWGWALGMLEERDGLLVLPNWVLSSNSSPRLWSKMQRGQCWQGKAGQVPQFRPLGCSQPQMRKQLLNNMQFFLLYGTQLQFSLVCKQFHLFCLCKKGCWSWRILMRCFSKAWLEGALPAGEFSRAHPPACPAAGARSWLGTAHVAELSCHVCYPAGVFQR